MVDLYLLSVEEAAKLPECYCAKHFPERLVRSRRFRQEADRLRCIGAGALLSGVLQIKESQIQYGEYEKPFVSDGRNFNLSHSGDYAMLAVGVGSIGCDIEQLNPRHLKIAKRIFTLEEQDWMAADPVDRFFILWTMKESVMKFFGKGLSLPPLSFSVMDLIHEGRGALFGELLYASSEIFNNYAISVCAGEMMNHLKPIILKAEDLVG